MKRSPSDYIEEKDEVAEFVNWLANRSVGNVENYPKTLEYYIRMYKQLKRSRSSMD
jgi:hypothetical protein